MHSEEKVLVAGQEVMERDAYEEVIERVEALSSAVGTLMERSVDAGLKAAAQVSDDGIRVAGEFMSLGSVLRKEAFSFARRVSEEVSAALGNNDQHG